MTASTVPDDLEIAPDYTVACWKQLKLDPKKPDSEDWKKAVEIFEARIRYRFLNPIDLLIAHEGSLSRKTFGFSILAIDFLVIETLQGFRGGETDHTRKSKCLIRKFLTNWSAFNDCLVEKEKAECCAKKIYEGYRCALHHSGATDGALRVLAIGPTFDFSKFKIGNEITINRTRFHENIKCEFNKYLNELRLSDKKELRCNFMKKMNYICGINGIEADPSKKRC